MNRRTRWDLLPGGPSIARLIPGFPTKFNSYGTRAFCRRRHHHSPICIHRSDFVPSF
jgi:hypothetical protein